MQNGLMLIRVSSKKQFSPVEEGGVSPTSIFDAIQADMGALPRFGHFTSKWAKLYHAETTRKIV